MVNANRDARAREGNGMDNNPIFQSGDLIWDGVIIREVPEITALATNCGEVFLCGAQAVGIAWGQEPTFQTDLTDDYKFRPGVAIEELRIGVIPTCHKCLRVPS